MLVVILIICIAIASYRAARVLVARRQAPALPCASVERTSFEDWIEVFRETAVAADGELSPELTQLLASPSEILAARTRYIEEVRTEAAGLVREARAEAERLLGEARSERLAALRATAPAPSIRPASNWLADQRPRLVLAPRSQSSGRRETLTFVLEKELTPADWQGRSLPRLQGAERSQTTMRATRLLVDGTVTFTLANACGRATRTQPISDRALFLTDLFFGNSNCLSAAARGLPLALARELLDDLPTLQIGLDATIGFSLGEAAVRIADLPDAFADADVVSAKVSIFALLEGYGRR